MARPAIAKGFVVPTDLLDDIASRFLLDAPDSELDDTIALCFLTELAYWFYLDEYVEEDDSLNNIKFDPFAQQLLKRVGIKPVTGTIEDMLQEFRDFKLRVPTYGGLLLNHDQSHVLLVQGFWHRASWGFPKGKINVDEESHNCAIREVLEETGYDISSMIDANIYLEMSIGEQRVRLYIITGVPMDIEFVPRTKGEIKQLKWFPIHQLPSHKNDRNFNRVNGSTNMFYMVMPFIKPLREWIASNMRGREGRRRHRSSTNNTSDQNSGHRQSRHNQSPVTAGEVLRRQQSSDSSRKHQNTVFSSFIKEEISSFEKQRSTTDSSPRRRENTKGKTRKSLFNENPEENPKFTFKSRGKGRNQSVHKSNRENQPPHNASEGANGGWGSKQPFQAYSWQSFQINRKEVNAAVESAWSGVRLNW